MAGSVIERHFRNPRIRSFNHDVVSIISRPHIPRTVGSGGEIRYLLRIRRCTFPSNTGPAKPSMSTRSLCLVSAGDTSGPEPAMTACRPADSAFGQLSLARSPLGCGFTVLATVPCLPFKWLKASHLYLAVRSKPNWYAAYMVAERFDERLPQ
jgi:hypothetical protein